MEDLLYTVIPEVNRYLSSVVEKEVKRREREVKKGDALTTMVDNIYWENFNYVSDNPNFICSPNKFVLTRKMGMTNKGIKSKGFTQTKKMMAIQKHYLSTCSSSTSFRKGQTVQSNSFALISENLFVQTSKLYHGMGNFVI